MIRTRLPIYSRTSRSISRSSRPIHRPSWRRRSDCVTRSIVKKAAYRALIRWTIPMDWSATSTTTSTARCTACSATGPPEPTRERSGWCSPTPSTPDAPFPIEVAAGEHIDRDYLSKFCAARSTIAECSRFILARRFRSRRGEQQWPDGLAEEGLDADRGSDERRVLTHPVLGLIKAAMIMSWERQVHYLYTAMEPRLDRRLRQFGLRALAGEPTDRISRTGARSLGIRAGIPRSVCTSSVPRYGVYSLENGNIWPAPRDDAASETQRQAS